MIILEIVFAAVGLWHFLSFIFHSFKKNKWREESKSGPGATRHLIAGGICFHWLLIQKKLDCGSSVWICRHDSNLKLPYRHETCRPDGVWNCLIYTERKKLPVSLGTPQAWFAQVHFALDITNIRPSDFTPFKTQCKNEFTYQSPKPPNFKGVLEW